MAEHKSDQITNLDSAPPVLPKANESHGRVRIAYWSFTTPAGGVAINDTVRLVHLPKGARILGGHFVSEDMSSGGAAATVTIGTAGDAARYLEATSVDAVTSGDFADTVARNFGDEVSGEIDILATATVEAWAAAKSFQGRVFYAVD